MKEMMQLVPVEEVYVQALQVKYPIINWKALVKEYLSIRPATSEKEMELWVELKTLYEPDPEDQLWTQTQNFMHAPVEWKLYDLCGVHQVTAKDKDIFMLVEKDYPLRKGLAIVMISKTRILKFLKKAYSYRVGNEEILVPMSKTKLIFSKRKSDDTITIHYCEFDDYDHSTEKELILIFPNTMEREGYTIVGDYLQTKLMSVVQLSDGQHKHSIRPVIIAVKPCPISASMHDMWMNPEGGGFSDLSMQQQLDFNLVQIGNMNIDSSLILGSGSGSGSGLRGHLVKSFGSSRVSDMNRMQRNVISSPRSMSNMNQNQIQQQTNLHPASVSTSVGSGASCLL
uniref:PHL domain-containing protein n=1 Tax=Tanacetum cinerariifolium TaxID=118510 RepID=A0A699I7P8_TANCI|nr:hypothetical protein [Tanacetum cinerariifolium]